MLLAPLFIAAELASSGMYWNPGLDSEGPEPVRYRTEGLASWKAQLRLGYLYPAFTFSYEFPFHPSARQRELLDANKTQNAGYERLGLGVDLLPLLKPHFENLEDTPILAHLLSLSYRYSETAFHGNADVSTDYLFLPRDAVVDKGTRKVTGGQRIAAGSGLSFRSEFTDHELTTSFGEVEGYDFRVGWYRLHWTRPSDNNYDYALSDGNSVFPVLYETSYESQGMVYGFRLVDPAQPGWSFEAAYRRGFYNRIRAALEKELERDEELEFYGLAGALRWRWNAREDNAGLYVGVGGEFDLRVWRLKVSGPRAKPLSLGLQDGDDLFKGTVTAGYRF